MTVFRIALAVSISLVFSASVGSSIARGAFPGSSGLIAYVNDRNGTPSIYTVEPDGTGVRRLVPNEPQGAYPAWSPGGRAILFSVPISAEPNASYELWAMSANGTGARRLPVGKSIEPAAATWSPNGKKIAFYQNGFLWIAKTSGAKARRLTSASFSNGSPSWSRRGRIAFDRDGSIWTVNVRTGALRRLGRGSAPSWSPNGMKLVFTTLDAAGENGDVYVMRANGSGRRRLTATAQVNETQPAWSPNGRRIAYAGRNGGLYVMQTNGKRSRRVARKGWQPSWAPRSSELVYSRRTPRWDGLVFRTGLSGRRSRQLLSPRFDANPQWSPDGQRLAFSRDGVVHIMNVDGGGLRSIKLKGLDPAWSSDGSLLVVSSRRQLVIANSDGTTPRRIYLGFDASRYDDVFDPEWSPAGREIAFVASAVSGALEVFVVSLDETMPVRKLPLGCSFATSPTWSPGGELLGLNCDQSIAIYSPDRRDLVPIASAIGAALAWSPDGSQIVFSEQSAQRSARLFVINADGSVLEQLATGPGASFQPNWQPLN